jgi:enamine deaminase RidA (YjgF/YER057c/UK114 family)
MQELKIVLPTPLVPIANYAGFSVANNLVYISGQLPIERDAIKYIGRVGLDASIEVAYKAARLCGLNILAQLQAACNGDLDLVTKCVNVSGFVNAVNTFQDHPKVINGCSDLIVEVFGTACKHSRIAVGVSSLPLNALVEVGAVFAVK